MEISWWSHGHTLNFSGRSSSWSLTCQFNGMDGSSCPLLVLNARAIPAASMCGNFLAGLEEDHRTDGQLHRGHFPGALTSQGSCQVKRQLLEIETESFVHWSTGDWTKATQVICHLLMGLINGWRVGRGWRCLQQAEPRRGLQGGSAAFHRFRVHLNAESPCVQSTCPLK